MRKIAIAAAAAATSLAITIAHAAPPLPEASAHQVGFSDQGLARLDDFFAREIAAKRV
ncbi:MAG TPA: penicillin-binding protein, partial [Bradyrhizobium sp.]|nr:penicillin-binding protein [Bradyrhizobium sp.]